MGQPPPASSQEVWTNSFEDKFFCNQPSSLIRYIANFTDDFEDSANFIYLLNAIAPKFASLDLLKIDDWEERAKRVLQITQELGCYSLIAPRDILDAENEKLILVFLAEIFRVESGLPKVTVQNTVDTGKKQQTVQDRAKEEQQEEGSTLQNLNFF